MGSFFMSFLKWNEELSVGIASVDAEHQLIVGNINKFYDAILTRQGSSVLNDFLVQLLNDIHTHFINEELLMSQTGYVGFQHHKAAHDGMKIQLVQFLERSKNGASHELANEVFLFLKAWLMDHLLREDMAYTAHFKAHGVQ
jgi:hemerythrin-like metal-binding protein